MQSIRSIIFAVSLAASLTPVSAAEWRTSIYEADGFSVDFSGSVDVQPLPVSEQTKNLWVRSTAYIQDSGTHGYNVAASLAAPSITLNLDAAADAVMARIKCTKIESDVTLPAAQGKMREIHASGCIDGDLRFGSRFLVRGQWYYQVFYMISSDEQAADAKRFLTSFKLIP